MIRARPIFMFLLVFTLAAFLAWIAGGSVRISKGTGNSNARMKRWHDREISAAASGNATELAKLEHEMLGTLPSSETYDPEFIRKEIVDAKERSRLGSFGHSTREFELAIKWARSDPATMLSWLVQERGFPEKDLTGYAAILFQEWARQDLKMAFSQISRIPGSLLRREALAACIERLGVDDPDKARGVLLENLDLFAGKGGFSGFGSHGLEKSTCALLTSLPPGEVKTRLLAGALAKMSFIAGNGADEAAFVWGKSDDNFRRELVAAGFRCGEGIGERFPGLESLQREHAEFTGKRGDADRFLESFGASWARRDLPAALEWTAAHVKGVKRVDRSVEFFGEAAAQDFDTAVEAWRELPQGILKARAAGAIFKNAPAERRTEAESLVGSLSEHDQELAR